MLTTNDWFSDCIQQMEDAYHQRNNITFPLTVNFEDSK